MRPRFTPDLPDAMQAALEGLHMGALTKVGLRLDRAKLGGADTADSLEVGERGALTSFDLWPHGGDLAIAAFGGDHARS